MLVVTPGHRQPDPRKQDVPHHLGDSDRRASRACSCSTTTCSSSGRTGVVDEGRRSWPRRNNAGRTGAADRRGRARHVRRRGRSAAGRRTTATSRRQPDASSQPDSLREATDIAWQSGESVKFWSTWASSPTSSWRCCWKSSSSGPARCSGKIADRHGPDHRRAVGPGAGRADGHAGRQPGRRR